MNREDVSNMLEEYDAVKNEEREKEIKKVLQLLVVYIVGLITGALLLTIEVLK